MPKFLRFNIRTPVEGELVGRNIVVQGQSHVTGSGEYPQISIELVELVLSDGSVLHYAGHTGFEWRYEGTPAATSVGGSPLTITAIISGTTIVDEESGPEWFEQSVSVNVKLEESVPETLTIDAFTSPVTPTTLPYHLDLTGTAGDTLSGIRAVQVRVGDGQFVDAVDVGGGFARWRRPLDLGAGEHHLTVRAVDGLGNVREASADLSVAAPTDPDATDEIFRPTRYLRELVEFASRYVEVDGSTGVLTPSMLAARFHQPFDRLSDIAMSEAATRPVAQARIAVEVLRGRLGAPAPQPLDQRFRARAYQTLLQQVGTSYDELRLARNAAPAERRALAERLGITLAETRPDRLDELTLPPAHVSDAQLQALFGYPSTASGDPLRTRLEDADFFLWQRDALTVRWALDDEAHRDSAAGALPIIEPDLVTDDRVRNRQADDAAFSLLTARREWMTATQARIEAAANAMGDPLTRFDALVATYVGTLDIAGLAARDIDGEDISGDLAPLNLELRAFRFLARCHRLLVDDELLDTELQDVVAILLQVQKVRQYRRWRLDERRSSIVLGPTSFVLDAAGRADLPPWRVKQQDHAEWQRTLAARGASLAAVDASSHRVVEAAESFVLPGLRDDLIAEIAERDSLSDDLQAAADALTRELMVGLHADAGQRTTRADQAIETLQAVLFSARVGRLDVDGDGDGQEWTIGVAATDERDFDGEWAWMSTYRRWLAAMRVFAYPENQLLPALYVGASDLAPPTAPFHALIEQVRKEGHLTPPAARRLAADYLAGLRAPGSGVPLEDALKGTFTLTDEKSDQDLVRMQLTSRTIHNPARVHQLEIFWLVPMALAAKLQECGQFQAALDWYQTVFAFQLPPESRRIYRGLAVEEQTTSNFGRDATWLLTELNPHTFAKERRNCYTRSTVMSIVGCLHAYADAEFAANTADGNARARTLYETAADLLALPEAQPESGPAFPFPLNPVWVSLREYGRASLVKLHSGLNIAGMSSTTSTAEETVLPSHYRYPVLVERAKNLVAIAQQVEAAFLSALEQRDARTYDALQAGQHLQVAQSTLAMHDVKVINAVFDIGLAGLQRDRAQLQQTHFEDLISDGPNKWEWLQLGGLAAAAALQTAAGFAFAGGSLVSAAKQLVSFGLIGNAAADAGQSLSAFAGALSTGAQAAGLKASFERRQEEWQLQAGLAGFDVQIADMQSTVATNQYQLALQERALSTMQMEHAAAVVTFLATRFTNAELFEWMSGVLGRVYAYFLQQATALAQLAEAQLAFERQELPAGFIRADYWRDSTAGGTGTVDRRGLTGSARLLEDAHRLDQYAFETDRRKLHLTQTFPLSQIAPLELQLLRDTGVLTFATPEVLFDREFPGHYLRLIKRVRISLVALLPPVRGVRATLSASGVSRTVVARGPFSTVTLRRDPESIAFTSANNASGMFELEPETGQLLPFEGMGVDTVWRLELPKAANPFDYVSIADVLLTIEYTALDSPVYRQQVVRSLDRRFSGDRAFSLRNDYPDVWFDLHNPDAVDPDLRMTALLPITDDDLPPHIEDLAVEHLTLFVLRKDSFTDELTVVSLRHTSAGQTSTGGEVHTNEGIISTRHPAGTPWRTLLGATPVGGWELRLPDDAATRALFTEQLIEDIVVLVTMGGTTPPWP